MRNVGPEDVLHAVDDLVHLALVAHQLQVDQARIVPKQQIDIRSINQYNDANNYFVFWNPAFPHVIM